MLYLPPILRSKAVLASMMVMVTIRMLLRVIAHSVAFVNIYYFIRLRIEVEMISNMGETGESYL